MSRKNEPAEPRHGGRKNPQQGHAAEEAANQPHNSKKEALGPNTKR